MNKEVRSRRMQNALWGLFIGDALAMPAHWYYNLKNIETAFHGGVRTYEGPPHPHPESFMVGMAYRPDVDTAKKMGRKYDILHEHNRFYQTTYSTLAIDRKERESERNLHRIIQWASGLASPWGRLARERPVEAIESKAVARKDEDRFYVAVQPFFGCVLGRN